MNRTVWVFTTLVLAGFVLLVVWIQQGRSQPPAAAIENTVPVMATATSQPDLPTATASSTVVSPTPTASAAPTATPTSSVVPLTNSNFETAPFQAGLPVCGGVDVIALQLEQGA